jgi:hypothetical protein
MQEMTLTGWAPSDANGEASLLRLAGELSVVTPSTLQGVGRQVRAVSSIDLNLEHFTDVEPHDAVIYAGLYVRRLRDHLIASLLLQPQFLHILGEGEASSSSLIL